LDRVQRLLSLEDSGGQHDWVHQNRDSESQPRAAQSQERAEGWSRSEYPDDAAISAAAIENGNNADVFEASGVG
jgi:hypothetical protein